MCVTAGRLCPLLLKIHQYVVREGRGVAFTLVNPFTVGIRLNTCLRSWYRPRTRHPRLVVECVRNAFQFCAERLPVLIPCPLPRLWINFVACHIVIEMESNLRTGLVGFAPHPSNPVFRFIQRQSSIPIQLINNCIIICLHLTWRGELVLRVIESVQLSCSSSR
eukprot:COSAG06_NODE_258_length_18940_cov_15.039648_13_plen_164_part_00